MANIEIFLPNPARDHSYWWLDFIRSTCEENRSTDNAVVNIPTIIDQKLQEYSATWDKGRLCLVFDNASGCVRFQLEWIK